MNKVVMFIVGAAVGSLATWKILHDRYEILVKEEVDSVRQMYREKYEETDDVEEDDPEELDQKKEFKYNSSLRWDALKNEKREEAEQEEMKKIIDTSDYAADEPVVEKGDGNGYPYCIRPEQFSSENPYYDKVSITRYKTGEFEDDDGKTLYTPNEIEEFIGLKNLESMGEYEKNVLYVRNDALETDYEIYDEDVGYLDSSYDT